MNDLVVCPACNRLTFRLVKRLPKIDVWRCAECKETRGWCPECRQGWVVSGEVTTLQKKVFVCLECNATWFRFADIGSTDCVNFEVFLQQHGVNPQEEDLKIMPFDELPQT